MSKILFSIILLLASNVAYSQVASGVTFCNVCDNFKLSQKGDDLLVVCPPSTTPIMTYKNCPNAKAKKVNGQIQLTCGNAAKQMPIVPKATTVLK